MLKKIYLLAFFLSLLTSHSYSQNLDEIKKYESCADELLISNFKTKVDDYFFAHFETEIDDYLSLSIMDKIKSNQVYEWFYEDCEKQAQTKPIAFDLKNTLYKEDINEVTSKVF